MANVTQAIKSLLHLFAEGFFLYFSLTMVLVDLGIRPKRELFIIFIITAVFAFYYYLIRAES